MLNSSYNSNGTKKQKDLEMKKLFWAFLVLTGCGFSPLYHSKTLECGNVPVFVAPIPNQYGASMRQTIQNKMGHAEKKLYTLSVASPSFNTWDQTIDSKNFATIMGISASVSYRLTENATKKVLLDSSTSLTSSYSVVKDPYATTVAERKVKKELAEQLADKVTLHVLGTLTGVHK